MVFLQKRKNGSRPRIAKQYLRESKKLAAEVEKEIKEKVAQLKTGQTKRKGKKMEIIIGLTSSTK